MMNSTERPGTDTSRKAKIVLREGDAMRVAVAAFVGTAMEWYDYYLFGTAAAIVFNKLYFTTLNASAALLASLATFGVGFVARPIGAIIFGAVGDRVGRRPALILSVVLIGVATGLIGLLPGYTSIGIAAPLLLVVLRLLQGFAVGGEWGGAVTMAVEHAPLEHRGRYAAMPQLGSPIGTLFSAGAFSLVLMLPASAFDSWGWRLPFLAAFPLLLIAVYIRIKMQESPLFLQLLKEEGAIAKIPVVTLFREAWGRVLVAIAASWLGIGGFYLLTTFVISYGVNTLLLPKAWMVNATLISAVFQLAALLIFGRVAEKLGAARMTIWGGIITAVVAFPVFWLIDTKNLVLIILAVVVGLVCVDIVYAALGYLLSELFPVRLRYSGVAISYNISGALSGFLPLIATALLASAGGASWIAAALLILVSLTTAVGAYFALRLRIDDSVEVAIAVESMPQHAPER